MRAEETVFKDSDLVIRPSINDVGSAAFGQFDDTEQIGYEEGIVRIREWIQALTETVLCTVLSLSPPVWTRRSVCLFAVLSCVPPEIGSVSGITPSWQQLSSAVWKRRKKVHMLLP